ncbi:MAG TPA: tryptophan 2,3-dioxygenase family protein [Bacteroidia bacterium]
MSRPPVHYGDYLQLERILDSQLPESDKEKLEAHDEMLFIIIHQAYELWFKQIQHELDSILNLMGGSTVKDNSPDLQTVVHRSHRIGIILKVLVQQIDILETMTPMDFLDFRDLLRPASGFQSWQFKIIEAKLGLKFEHRHGQAYYTSQLRPREVEMIKQVESQPSLMQMLNTWLERMPFFDDNELWKNFNAKAEKAENLHVFWNEYRNVYMDGLVEGEKSQVKVFDEIFLQDKASNPENQLSPKAMRAALFIMLYRGYPLLQYPYQLLNNLLEIDEQMATWRFRHINMVHRIIGMRVGTGGSTGKEYLMGALSKHYIFKEIAMLTSFLIERRRLPALSKELESRLGFVS